MKVELQLEMRDSWHWYNYVNLARVKLVDDDGKYIKFIHMDNELITKLMGITIDLDNCKKRIVRCKSRRKTPWQRELF